jgi:outer membrane protein assembly factor BamB
MSEPFPAEGNVSGDPVASEGATFTVLASSRGTGMILNAVVGPGPAPGSERLYRSYTYVDGEFDLVAIDPETGEHTVFPSPIPGEEGAWALAVGPDGNLYVGTDDFAHLCRLDPRTGELVDLGRPSPSEDYIWQLALASDGRLYGGTYPSAKLIRYDPATGAAEVVAMAPEPITAGLALRGRDVYFASRARIYHCRLP